jgi:hypothetical protein
MQGDRIAAIVIAAEPAGASTEEQPSPEAPCTRPAGDQAKGLAGICLAAGELLRTQGDDIFLVTKDGEKPITQTRVPGLVYATALRNPLDNRDDLIAIARSDDGLSRTWSLVGYRLADGKLVATIAPTVLYTVTSASARWIGADLENLDLYLDLASHGDSIEVGGLLTTRISDKIRDIVVITPVPVPRKRTKPSTHELIDAGTSDKAVEERTQAP